MIYKNIFGKEFKIIEVYRGVEIKQYLEPETCKIINHNREVLNKDIPYYSVYLNNPKAYISGSCYIPEGGDLSYIKKEIDKGIERRREVALEKLKIRNNSKFYTYICNNVTIRILQYGRDCDIFVNDRPLRDVYLPENFTFNNVLAQVYYNKIANYNVSFWGKGYREGLKYNNYVNHKTEYIDLDILPIYEFIGQIVEIRGKEVYISSIDRTIKGDFILNDKYVVLLNEVKNLKVIEGTFNKWESLVAMRNKIVFYE